MLRNVLVAVASIALVASGRASAAGDDTSAPPVAQILAAYARATGDDGIRTFESIGTLTGEGLAGDFHSWRSGANERDDERLGPRSQTTLRLGDRRFVRTPSGNVRELTGYLRRRALTADFVDSGAFVAAPERSRFVGFGELKGERAWRLEVRAQGGEPETVWIAISTGLPLRVEYLDGDGTESIEYADWRSVGGRRFPFELVTSDGDPAFDIVAQTTSIQLGGNVPDGVFALPQNRALRADGVQTVPLLERNGHVACSVVIGGKPYEFLLDSGAQSVLLDSGVASALGLSPTGALEVRGAARLGGLQVLDVPRIDIGRAHLDDIVATSLDLHRVLDGADAFDGILGVPFFASSLVELDFARHTMRFGAPGSFTPHGRRIALDLDRGLVESVLHVNGSLDVPFIIDTGNSGTLLLYRPFVTAHPGIVPPGAHEAASSGIGGAASAYRSSLDTIDIGDVALHDTAVDVMLAGAGAFADRIDAGNVGLGILQDFIVTFDLTHAALYLDKRDASPETDSGR